MTTIQYNGINPFGNQPTPFFGVADNNISYGERWGVAKRITLVGQLTGCTFSGLTAAQTSLISGFSRDFQTLQIFQNGTGVDVYPNSFINSISFPSSSYVGVLPYQIELTCYPQSGFSGIYGVLDPANTWDYREGRNGIIEISHNVSARGIHTSGGFNALDNARSFVLARTGFSSFVSPQFIRKFGNSGILKSQVENINRLDGTYGITEVFQMDQFLPCEYGILRYSVDYGINQAGFNQVSIAGSFEGGINDSFELIRGRSSGFDYYSSALYGINSGIKLNPVPTSRTITENQFLRKIDFNLNFDDNPNYFTNRVYDISINSGDGLFSVAINGEINGRGDLANRWERVKSEFRTINPYALASSEFATYAGTGIILNPTPVTETVAYDNFNGTISFGYEYKDKELPPNSNLLDFNYTINVTPPLRKIISTPLVFKNSGPQYSKYEITDVGFDKRGIFSINGSAIPNRLTNGSAAINAVKDAIRNKFTTYSAGSNFILEGNTISQTNEETIGFTADWSYFGAGVIQGTNYSTIAAL